MTLFYGIIWWNIYERPRSKPSNSLCTTRRKQWQMINKVYCSWSYSTVELSIGLRVFQGLIDIGLVHVIGSVPPLPRGAMSCWRPPLHIFGFHIVATTSSYIVIEYFGCLHQSVASTSLSEGAPDWWRQQKYSITIYEEVVATIWKPTIWRGGHQQEDSLQITRRSWRHHHRQGLDQWWGCGQRPWQRWYGAD